MALERAVETVRKLIPDLDERISRFEVESVTVDNELLSIFCEELERMSRDIQVGLDNGNYELIRKTVHSIKGMGGAMGLPEISVLAQEIEDALRSGQEDRFVELCTALIEWANGVVADNQSA